MQNLKVERDNSEGKRGNTFNCFSEVGIEEHGVALFVFLS